MPVEQHEALPCGWPASEIGCVYQILLKSFQFCKMVIYLTRLFFACQVMNSTPYQISHGE